MRIDNFYQTLDSVTESYTNTPECHATIFSFFEKNIGAYPPILNHRRFITTQKLGFSYDAHHWMWKLIVDTLPKQFNFLEIGVYCGQVISLIELLSSLSNKQAKIFGVTPLGESSNPSIGSNNYEAHVGKNFDYLAAIKRVYESNSLSMGNTSIVKGFSQDPMVTKHMYDKNIKFDVVFVDGDHAYEAVKEDIRLYEDLVKVGGLLVTDDASYNLNMPEGIFKGWPETTQAIDETVANSPKYKHLFACANIRVWRKVA